MHLSEKFQSDLMLLLLMFCYRFFLNLLIKSADQVTMGSNLLVVSFLLPFHIYFGSISILTTYSICSFQLDLFFSYFL